MTTATKPELDIDVQFGNVSIGAENARLGVKIDRGNMDLDSADEMLCGKRLTGRIEVCPPGEQQGQQALPGMKDERPHLDGTFDVNRSDAELTPKDVVRPFSTHAEALAWCNAREAEIVADEAKTTPEIVIGGEA